MAKTNPFDIFAVNNKTAFIKSLDREVTFRPLTKKESDAFNARLLGEYSGQGDINIDLAEANKINMEKVALCLVDPKITVEEMLGYGDGINEFINEVVALIDNRKVEEETEEEGN